MAFDLAQYFAEQIKTQKPQLLNNYSDGQRENLLDEMCSLSLARIICLWREQPSKMYQEIHAINPLYIQEIARHLTTSPLNESELSHQDFEQTATDLFNLQFSELKQLDEIGHYGENGMHELLVGQIEHLSGQAKDWVWSLSGLTELLGSQRTEEDELSLEESMKEFNQMVHAQQTHNDVETVEQVAVPELKPTWEKVLEPIVALVVLWILYDALTKYVFI